MEFFGFSIWITHFRSIVALFIVILILKTVFDVAKDNINNILGKLPSENILKDIKSTALSIKGAIGIHDIKINYVETLYFC